MAGRAVGRLARFTLESRGFPAFARGVAMNIPRRRLSAILHADLAGFVRLTEGEEDLTFNHLRLVRSEVWRPAIESAGGAVVHSNGDAMLVEFELGRWPRSRRRSTSRSAWRNSTIRSTRTRN